MTIKNKGQISKSVVGVTETGWEPEKCVDVAVGQEGGSRVWKHDHANHGIGLTFTGRRSPLRNTGP